MNHNLLREDERKLLLQVSTGHRLGLLQPAVELLLSRLCEARAEKYEFAAQQLEQATLWGICPADVKQELQKTALELRRLANG